MACFESAFPFHTNLDSFLKGVSDEFEEYVAHERKTFLSANPDLEFVKPRFFDSDVMEETIPSYTVIAIDRYAHDLEDFEIADKPDMSAGPLFLNTTFFKNAIEELKKLKAGEIPFDEVEKYGETVSCLIILLVVNRIYKEMLEDMDDDDSELLTDTTGEERLIVEAVESTIHHVKNVKIEVLLSASGKAAEKLHGMFVPESMFLIAMGMEIIDEDEWRDASDSDSE